MQAHHSNQLAAVVFSSCAISELTGWDRKTTRKERTKSRREEVSFI
jgi:hypothetical protein